MAIFIYSFLHIFPALRKWWVETGDNLGYYTAYNIIVCGDSHMGGHIFNIKSLQMTFEILNNWTEIKNKLNPLTFRTFSRVNL